MYSVKCVTILLIFSALASPTNDNKSIPTPNSTSHRVICYIKKYLKGIGPVYIFAEMLLRGQISSDIRE